MTRFFFFLSDIIDDNSQTVTTDHSRTPSPQKAISTATIPPIPPQKPPSSSVHMFVPKPFRSNNQESVRFKKKLFFVFFQSSHKIQELTFSRKELLTLMVTIYFTKCMIEKKRKKIIAAFCFVLYCISSSTHGYCLELLVAN
jgi:hypothetical protein